MKIRVNLWLTVFLFLMMLSGGIASSYVGYFMGREALKVVTQPDVSSEDFNKNQKPLGGEHKGLKIIKEKDILIKVYNQVHAENK
ncbi:hypothetical protein I4641_01265 [Waterburya agarophytonicola K14]|uniref:Uncharacterized protein n=1 Tax=Waterburya agarophytonicola KI4 TaxID=2874699 RepID=A0A964BPM9_9CYAN|nr:hypothetical protein [Waterburya agarophytonicola]MCC0175610.1 hypothetical protein [Waterburya agarophytonicola KI4]